MRAGKWEGVMPLPPNFFSFNPYDLKFMSFKFGNDIFVTFEMPRLHKVQAQEIKFLLFRPSVIRGPCPILKLVKLKPL